MKGIYTTYKSWLAAAKKAGAVRLDGDKDIAMAFDKNGRGVAEWDGAEGYIYQKSEMRNPMRRESPLYVKYLSLKSDEEPFMMQGTKYEYVWAEYPGGIKDIGVYSYAGDVVYSYDSFRQMMNLDRTATNPRDARASSRKEEYDDFSEWERDAFAAGATQIVKLGEGFSALRTKDGSMVKVDAEGYFDPRSRDAIKNRKNRINIGSWLGDSGTIYRHIIKNYPEFFAYENPVRPRKGEPSRAFVSRCMSEEKASFPEPKQRIAVCLSKSRKRNPVYDTGSDE